MSLREVPRTFDTKQEIKIDKQIKKLGWYRAGVASYMHPVFPFQIFSQEKALMTDLSKYDYKTTAQIKETAFRTGVLVGVGVGTLFGFALLVGLVCLTLI